MSLASGSRVVESVLVSRSPRLTRKKQQRPGQSLHLHSRSTRHHGSSMRLSAYRCEVGSFRNVKGTKWLVVWAEQDGGSEIEQPEDKSPPSPRKVVSVGTAVQIFFAAMLYIIFFFGASVTDGNSSGRRGPRR